MSQSHRSRRPLDRGKWVGCVSVCARSEAGLSRRLDTRTHAHCTLHTAHCTQMHTDAHAHTYAIHNGSDTDACMCHLGLPKSTPFQARLYLTRQLWCIVHRRGFTFSGFSGFRNSAVSHITSVSHWSQFQRLLICI